MQEKVYRYSLSGRKKTKAEVLDSYLTSYKVRCKCGHTIVMVKRSKVLCSHCGHYVYKDKKEEFKDKMRKLIKWTRIEC